jgi:hypothetical protein
VPVLQARSRPVSRRLALLFLVALLFGAGVFVLAGPQSPPRRPIGLFTSLPIFWPEAAGVSDLLKQESSPHWARQVLEEHGPVELLDTLSPVPRQLGLLIMAQPRPLSPQENVAIDDWVRNGGRVLLFADPMLTFDSSFSIGDRRRPEDVVLLSPILARWGLELQFDDAQPRGQRILPLLGGYLPVSLAGRFAISNKGPSCKLMGDGVAAICAIGRGEVLAVADAALLEPSDDADRAGRRAMLKRLIESAENTP